MGDPGVLSRLQAGQEIAPNVAQRRRPDQSHNDYWLTRGSLAHPRIAGSPEDYWLVRASCEDGRMVQLIFDLGGVLASETTQLAAAAATIGAGPDVVAARYWTERDAYDGGATNLEYWGPIAAGAGVQITPEMAARLGEQDADLWIRLRPAAERLLAEVSAAGAVAHLLSNAPVDLAAAVERSGWRRYLSRVFVSGVIGHRKPSPAIYEHVENALGVTGPELAFIDDREENLVGAAEHGWHTHLWRSDADTRDWLRRLDVLS